MKKLISTLALGLLTCWHSLNAQIVFNYTGGPQNYTIPAGCTVICFTVSGAQGMGNVQGSMLGGLGGRVTGQMPVTPGQVIQINVGQGGIVSNAGGFNGGANGGVTTANCCPNSRAGGGGGASDIRFAPYGLNDRMAVGGGGGGTGGNRVVGCSPGCGGGGGGGWYGGGGGGAYGGSPGAGGTQVAGGNGGASCCGCPQFPQPGAMGVFGNGGAGGGVGCNNQAANNPGCAGGVGGALIGGMGPNCTGGTGCPSTWAGASGGGGSNYANGICMGVAHFAGVQAGNGVVTIIPNCCAQPTIVPAANPATVCAGQSTTLSATGAGNGGTYTWTPGGLTGSAVVVSPSATTVYSVTGANTLACTGTSMVTVSVFPSPTVTPGNNGPVCSGGTLSLTVNAANSYTWSGPNGFASNLQNPTIANVTNANAGVYTVVVASVNGCTAMATTTVVVNSVPLVNPTNTGPYCVGATISLSVAAGTAYSWTGPNGFTSNLQLPTIANAQLVNGGVYNVTVTAAGGCQSTGSTTVVINPNPTPTAGSNSPLCAGQSTLNLSGSGGLTYTWTGPGGFASNLQNPVIAPVQGSNSGVYTLSVTNNNGCVGTATVDVIVNLPPVVASANSTVCVGSVINLTSNGGGTYAWTGPNGFVSNLQNPTIPNAQLANSGNYTVNVTSPQNCTASAVSNVSVIALPQPSIGSNSPVCENSTLTFTGSGGTSYNWTGPNGFASNLQNPTIPNVSLAAGGVYTLVVTAGSCTNAVTANVVVNALPTPTAQSNSPVCLLQPINFTGMGGVTYTWTGPGGFLSNAQNPVIAVAQNSNAGVYTLSVTNANGCVNFVTTNVVIDPLPNVTTNSVLVCLNSAINLSANGAVTYAWSGPSGFTSNQQNPVIPNAQFNNGGNYTVTGTSAQGCTNSAVAIVSVVPLPVAGIQQNGPVCVGATLSFTGSGGQVYNWTGPNGFSSNAQNPGIPNVSMAAAGDYTLLVSSGTCTNSATANVVVNPLPAPVANVNSPVCLNQPANFTGNGGTTYTWTGPGNFMAQTQNPVIASAQQTNAGTYTLTVTDNNGCSNATTTNLMINPLPNVNTIDQVNCMNTTINLSAGGAVSYTWSGPSGFTSNLQNPSIPNAQFSNAGQYVVIGESAQGCTNSAVANVTVLPLPVPVINSNAPVCAGSVLSLTATGGTSYAWAGPNGFFSQGSQVSINNVQLAAAGLYTVVTTVGTCTGSSTANISVNPLPTPSATASSPICLLQTLNLSVTGASSYTWSGPNNFTTTGSNPVIVNASMMHAGNYTVTAADNNNCVNTTIVNVVVNPLPVIAASGSTLCANKTLTLSASGGTSFTWSGPAGFSSNTQNPVIPNATPGMAGDYTVSVTDMNGCSSSSVTNVVVNPIPSASVNANSPVCASQTVYLNAQSSTAISYLWLGPNGFSSNNQNTGIANAQPISSGVYTLTVTDNIGCSTDVLVAVLVNPKPLVSAASDNTKGCVPLCMNMNPQSSTVLQSCQWQFGDGTTGTGVSSVKKCYTTAGAYNVVANFTDINGCTNTATFNVEAYPIPVANFNITPGKPVEGDKVEFSDASMNATIAEWNWNFSHESDNVQVGSNASTTYPNAGSYVVALVVISDKGCRDTIVKPIVIGEDFGVYVPDAFTPNGDGVNDTFQPKGFGIVKYELTVFDRWGEKLFTSTDFATGWDGSYKGLELVKQDVYVWKIKITNVFGKTKEMSGKVSLIR